MLRYCIECTSSLYTHWILSLRALVSQPLTCSVLTGSIISSGTYSSVTSHKWCCTWQEAGLCCTCHSSPLLRLMTWAHLAVFSSCVCTPHLVTEGNLFSHLGIYKLALSTQSCGAVHFGTSTISVSALPITAANVVCTCMVSCSLTPSTLLVFIYASPRVLCKPGSMPLLHLSFCHTSPPYDLGTPG